MVSCIDLIAQIAKIHNRPQFINFLIFVVVFTARSSIINVSRLQSSYSSCRRKCAKPRRRQCEAEKDNHNHDSSTLQQNGSWIRWHVAFLHRRQPRNQSVSWVVFQLITLLIPASFHFSGPVPVLVMSLLFIASVFMLHIWGKFTKA